MENNEMKSIIHEPSETKEPLLTQSNHSASLKNKRLKIYNHDEFVYQTMMTCIGNKRKLVKEIKKLICEISKRLNKIKLNIVDGFSGSSVVSRELSDICETLYVNDMEKYAYMMAKCFLITPTKRQQLQIKKHIETMNNLVKTKENLIEGIICKYYSPQDTNNIKEEERCFYTRENALIIDTMRHYIQTKVEEELQVYCLVPLLTKASIHTNTGGVFKGFYKSKDGIGKFGGDGENALSRIMKPIELDIPLWNNINKFECICNHSNINDFIKTLPNEKSIDVIYLDPPYNQHPYGSNYFMLNVIIENKEPEDISKVSGIPKKWNKSDYNTRSSAVKSMKELLKYSTEKSKYVILSYNNEGIIKKEDWDEILQNYNVEKKEITYDTYKASRNLKKRNNKVIEIMYIITEK
jgi:adenine-specific DNA-methyltransferase